MELEIIKHKDILFKDILRAIKVKSVAWPYPVESQVKWIIDNLGDFDEHVFLKEGVSDRAYLNLVRITFTSNDTEYMAYGIGNVCSSEKGKGYGKELMLRVGKYLEHKKYAGLLFCHTPLLQFYSRFGWEEIRREVCNLESLSDKIHVMSLFVPEETTSFNYNGKLF